MKYSFILVLFVVLLLQINLINSRKHVTGTCKTADDCSPELYSRGEVTCAQSYCVIKCEKPFSNCGDGPFDSSTACSIDLSQDSSHCGLCSHNCLKYPNVADALCHSGSCIINQCVSGYRDCDGDFKNGCETLASYCSFDDINNVYPEVSTNTYWESFDGIDQANFDVPIQELSNGFSYYATPSNSDNFYFCDDNGDIIVSTINSASSILFGLDNNNIYSFGGNFYVTDALCNFQSGVVSFLITADDGTIYQPQFNPLSANDDIFYVFDQPIVSLSVSSPDATWISINNFFVAGKH